MQTTKVAFVWHLKTYAKISKQEGQIYQKAWQLETGGIACLADDPNCLTKIQFVELLHAAGVFEDRKRLKKDAFRVFIYSQNTTLDEFQRSKESSLRDDSKPYAFRIFGSISASVREDHIEQKNSRAPFAKAFEIFIDEIVRKSNL